MISERRSECCRLGRVVSPSLFIRVLIVLGLWGWMAAPFGSHSFAALKDAIKLTASFKEAQACTMNPVVINSADSGLGSLREAILNACDGSTISFANTVVSPITLTGGQLTIDKNLAIAGPGAGALSISGNNASRVFDIASGSFNVTISGLTVSNGNQSGNFGGGIRDASTGTLSLLNSTLSNGAAINGGGIFSESSGTIVVTNSTLSNNTATFGSGGGGITLAEGQLIITNSLFTNNTSQDGGAILNLGSAPMTIINSTLTNNHADANFGGAIYDLDAPLVITNSTLANNSARIGGGIFTFSARPVTLKNTIVANNMASSSPDISGIVDSRDHNLIKDIVGVAITGVTTNNIYSQDPRLGALQNNGGSTMTRALLPGSPAIDAGDDSVLGGPLFLTTDQRGLGFPRRLGLHVDIGAFESQLFDTCLKDNSTGNLLQWNSTTGAYTFTRCSDGFTLSGVGAIALVNGYRVISDLKNNRRINAGFNTGQLTGTATIYLQVAQGVWQVFRIVSTNPFAACRC